LHNNMEIERKAFKVLSEEVDNIYLTEAELKKLFSLEIKDKKLEIVRDVFLIGCYTALRYSDYGRISVNNIKDRGGVKYLEIIQKKTQNKVVIPLKPEAVAILRKYDFNLPKTYEQQINEGIKEAGELAKINEVIYFEVNKGGLRVKQSAPKFRLIKAHTARRTGCTLMYLAGLKTIDIMKISGHKTEKVFLKYIKITKEETAVSMASHPYFAGANMKVVG
jgi:integrase